MPYGAGRAGRFGAFRGGCGGDVRPGGQLYLEPEKKQWKHRYTFDADGSKLCGFFDERALPEVTVYVGEEPYVYRAKRSAWRSYAPIGYRIFDMIRVNEQ